MLRLPENTPAKLALKESLRPYFVVEFKSPYFKPLAHLEIPKWYFSQLEFERHVPSLKCNLLVSSNREFSTSFICQNDKDFTLDLIEEAQSNFIMESGFTRQFAETSKELKEKL